MRTESCEYLSALQIVGSFLNVVAEKIPFADEEYKRRRYARTDCSCDSTSEPEVCDRIQNDGAVGEMKEKGRNG